MLRWFTWIILFSMAANSWTWGMGWQSFLNKFSSLVRSPKVFKNGSATLMPPVYLTVDNLNDEVKSEMSRLRYEKVNGLIEKVVPDSCLPFPVDTALVESLKGILQDCPPFMLNKHLSQAKQAMKKAKNIDKGDSDETLIAEWLNDIAAGMAKATGKRRTKDGKRIRFWTGDNATTPIPSQTSKQKPDLTLHDYGEANTNSFASIRVICEHTTEAKFPKRTTESLLRRIREMFQEQPGRRFILGLLISDREFSFHFFDRSGVWESKPLDIIKNIESFYWVIAGCAFADLTSLGFDPSIIYVNHKPKFISVVPSDSQEKEVLYRILKVLYVARGILGRGTVCYLVFRGNEFYIIKEVWHDMDLMTEYDHLVHKVMPIGDPRLPTVYAGFFPDVGRGDDMDFTGFYKPDDAKTEFDRMHLKFVMQPVGTRITDFCCKRELISVFIDVITAHENLCKVNLIHRDINISNILIQISLSGRDIKRALEENSEWIEQGLLSEARIAEFIDVMTQYPPTSFPVEDDSTLTTAERIQRLSFYSMTFKNAFRPGLLNDFDFAGYTLDYVKTKEYQDLLAPFDSDIYNAHSGTVPFMSIDELYAKSNGVTNYHHTAAMDLESLLYILIWICFNYSGPGDQARPSNEIKTLGTSYWITIKDPAVLANIKVGQMNRFDDFLDGVHSYFEDMKPVLTAFRDVLWPEKIMKPSDYGARTKSQANHAEVIAVLMTAKAKEGKIREFWERGDLLD